MIQIARKALFTMIANSEKEEKDIDIAEEFLNSYKYAAEELEAKSGYAPSKTISPSSIKCIRTATFKLLGATRDKKRTSESLAAICQNGSQRHENIQYIISKMENLGLEFKAVNIGDYIRENNIPLTIKKESNFAKGEFETKLFSEHFTTSFLADGMIEYKGKKYLLEIKTQPFESSMRQEDVHKKHKEQAMAYCVLLHVDAVLFFYEERNFMGKKCFLFKPTKQELDYMQDKLERINEFASAKVIPAKPADSLNDRNFCQYCDYANLCHAYGNNECAYNG